jgi:hypothetical protein
MKNYTALIKVTRLHEIGFESSDAEQAIEDAKTIMAIERFDDNSHNHQEEKIVEVTEDKLSDHGEAKKGCFINYKHIWERTNR